MAVHVSTVAEFFSGEEKHVKKGENPPKSGRLQRFVYDGMTGVVKASMKDKTCPFQVRIHYMFSCVPPTSSVTYCNPARKTNKRRSIIFTCLITVKPHIYNNMFTIILYLTQPLDVTLPGI